MSLLMSPDGKTITLVKEKSSPFEEDIGLPEDLNYDILTTSDKWAENLERVNNIVIQTREISSLESMLLAMKKS